MQRLGEMLVREKLIDLSGLQAAQNDAQAQGTKLSSSLLKLKLLSDEQLLAFLSKQYRVSSVHLTERLPDVALCRMLGPETVTKYQVLPLGRQGPTLTLAMIDPANIVAIDDVKFLTGLNIEIVLAGERDMEQAISKVFPPTEASAIDRLMSDFHASDIEVEAQEAAVDVNALAAGAEDAPVVRLVNHVLVDAIDRRASDIHIEPYEKSFRVRLRIDGGLTETMSPPPKLKGAVVSRIKIMAGLDIAERRLPQDGRIKLKLGGNKEMDFRVSVLPTLFGEKVVMRLLDKSNLQLDMTKLGFEEHALKSFKHAIHQPFGIVLVTGPTGSGKTTTLYSALAELNKVSENISTAEDPVEFNLAGINQVQMHADIGLNFAAALRSFLRQDPDIIMVGEIRDFETCEIAIKAALTGHLVLSTLHTNDAPSTISRMMNMGIEPFLIAASLNGIVAQRLVRKVCQSCTAPAPRPPEDVLRDLQVKPEQWEKANFALGKGCETCNNTGLKGRVAIYEVMTSTDEIKAAILRGASSTEIKQVAVKGGLKTLRQSAISKLLEGLTTVEEVVRTTAAD